MTYIYSFKALKYTLLRRPTVKLLRIGSGHHQSSDVELCYPILGNFGHEPGLAYHGFCYTYSNHLMQIVLRKFASTSSKLHLSILLELVFAILRDAVRVLITCAHLQVNGLALKRYAVSVKFTYDIGNEVYGYTHIWAMIVKCPMCSRLGYLIQKGKRGSSMSRVVYAIYWCTQYIPCNSNVKHYSCLGFLRNLS